MRFMMMVYPKAPYATDDPDHSRVVEQLQKMNVYNKELEKAGVLLTLDGLRAPATGASVHFKGGKATVTDGPFAEAKEVIGGFWMIQVRSREEAIEWARRAPMEDGDVIEVRQVSEMADFAPEVLKALR